MILTIIITVFLLEVIGKQANSYIFLSFPFTDLLYYYHIALLPQFFPRT